MKGKAQELYAKYKRSSGYAQVPLMNEDDSSYEERNKYETKKSL